MHNQNPPNPTPENSQEHQVQLPQTPNRRGSSSGRGRPRGGAIRHTGNCAATIRAMQQVTASHQDSDSHPSAARDSRTGDVEDPDDQSLPAPTASQKGAKKLRWTGPMEVMLLELYVQEVEKGKRADNRFQNTSHRHVAQQLREAFPEIKQLLDYNKCKSKLNQLFKKDYDTFLACKEASGFGWDETLCEVTASHDVWERYVAVHPNARKFWGVPYPEFRNLDKIFGTSLATGEGSRSLGQRLLMPSQPAEPDRPEGMEPQSDQNNSPTNYLSRGHKKDSIASAISGLVGYMNTQREEHAQRIQQRAANNQSNLQRAMALYQEVHAEEASQNEQLEAFRIFRDDLNAQMFTSILDKDLRTEWLHREMDQMHQN
ncbi:hypothetical protein PTTG_02066 [Puccinia triticina 1-1 BBBD Race 1]|uniref:Myb_DNA-bind_3 domain-containing protein n=1 Tax=Puccinia triticina (isolate 1-1 / race 1 (BBBD)) TaxID=630390 RepID=A0A0C4EMS6_PUCT1|nr:hypothetical protein PTTG_02066 [Puccinia triticina 1-1 BBBD Race 1]